MHQEVVERARLPPRMPTRVTVMADSDGSPQRDDRHHRRSRSRLPVSSPEWTGGTLAEREERRLAEAAVLVGPPPPAREPGPAETAALPAQAASPAATPRPDAQEAETAASHAAAPAAAPGTPPTRGAAPAQEPGASPRAAAAAEESKKGARGVATDPARAAGASPAAAAAAEENKEGVRGVATAATGASSAAATAAKESEEGARGAAAATPAGRDASSAGHVAAPSTPRKRGKNPARAADASPAAAAAAAVGRESAKYRAHANPTHTHTSPPKPFPPKPFPAGRERHVRPPTRERSPPGVTLPQLQRQRDARRVVQEGRSGGGEGSSGRRDRQWAGEGPGHGKGAQGREQGAQVQGAGRGEVGERAGQGVGDGRRDPRHGQGAGEGPGHGKGAQGRGQGTQVQGAGRGGVGERAGQGVGDGRQDPRNGQGAGKGPKGKGKGAAGAKGQAGRGMGAQGGGRGEGRGAEGGAPPQPDVQPVRCIPPGIQPMPAHHTPPSRPACSALRVAGRPLRVSLTLARWYAIPCGLCVPRARSGCPSGSPRVSFSCVCARALAVSAPPPRWVVWRAHLAWSRHWALVGPFHVVRAPPRVLPRSRALSGVLGGGRSGPGSPLLGLGLWGRRQGVPGGVPSTVAWGVWGLALLLPRLPVH